jgi:hypothetical protein
VTAMAWVFISWGVSVLFYFMSYMSLRTKYLIYRQQLFVRDMRIHALEGMIETLMRQKNRSSSSSSDLYEKFLRHVSKEGLNRIWRVVALELHPDQHPGIDSNKFKQASSAYNELMKRKG